MRKTAFRLEHAGRGGQAFERHGPGLAGRRQQLPRAHDATLAIKLAAAREADAGPRPGQLLRRLGRAARKTLVRPVPLSILAGPL